MALLGEALIQEISELAAQRHQALAAALGKPTTSGEPTTLGAASPLRRDLELLIRIANGEQTYAQASPTLIRQIEQALDDLLKLMFGNVLGSGVQIPDDFWARDVGILVSRVRWWLSADDLITISNAAALAFGENTQANRMRVARAMEKGLLAWIPDPSVANPQQNRRVLRSQVEQLRSP